MGPSRAEQGRLGLSGVGEGLGMHWDSNYSKTRPWGQGLGQVGPRGACSGRVGPVGAEWGWGGVGHALGFKLL